MDDDSFEIEITDLRGEPASAARWWLPRPLTDLSPDDECFGIALTDLHSDPATAPTPLASAPLPQDRESAAPPRRQGASPLARRAGRSARLVGGTSAAALLTVALAVALLGSPVARGPLNSLFATPTATEPGVDTFQLVNDAPWGKLTADGHPIAHMSYDGQPLFFRLDGGTHQLEFVAPPFPTLRCQVSVPAAASDTCPQAHDTQQLYLGTQPLRLEGVRVLDLRASVDNLPVEQRTQLIAATQALFDTAQQQTAVYSGEHYLAGDQSIRVAQSALQATQAIELNTNLNTGITINGESCSMICSLPDPAAAYGGWTLVATVTLIWRLVMPDGTLVAETIPHMLDGAQMPIMPIPLNATWRGTWQVGFASDGGGPFGASGGPGGPVTAMAQVLCSAAQFNAARQITPSTDYGSIGWSGVAPNPADGCVVVNQATNPEDQLVGQPEYLLYRLGVLLAANPLAHRLNPGLPLADAHEAALAQQAAAVSEPAQYRGG